VFRGRSKHNLDAKGRLAIPTRFREVLGERGEDSLILTNHYGCLWAYTKSDWLTIEKKAMELPEFDENVNIYLRYFISGAKECPLKQNRITIPADLREIAELNREVVLVGSLKHFEIWNKERWEEIFQRDKDRFPMASQSLREFGI